MMKTNEQLAIESLFRIIKAQGTELDRINDLLSTKTEESMLTIDILQQMQRNTNVLVSRIENLEYAMSLQAAFNDKDMERVARYVKFYNEINERLKNV